MMHPLLERQLRKVGLDSKSPPSAEGWRALLERVSAAYAQADQDRYIGERALEQTSEEMAELYDELRATSDVEIAQKTELAKSLALVTAVLESVADGILVMDASGKVLNYNHHFVEIWRIPDDAVQQFGRRDDDGKLLLEHCRAWLLRPDEEIARAEEHATAPEALVVDDLELIDGRMLSRYSSPIRTPDGEMRARVWCFRDVTEERRLAARRAVVAERMASVGQLVASVAHEINNPLAYIAGNVDVVLDALEREEPLEVDGLVDALEDARAGVDRIKVIVRDLRALSRVDDETREPTDLRSVLETALQMASNELRHRARIVRDLRLVPLVNANPVRLTQVFLNLLVNAAHAIPDGRASENQITVRTTTSTTGRPRIEIRDTGCGIAPENLERIYDPFFTTKPVGSGTGLGLSICKGIIDKLGGSIEVQSRLGSGTTFVVELPPSSLTTRRESRAPGVVHAATNRRSVLVVDDDAKIRRWCQRILVRHEVTTVPSVEAAEEVLTTRSFDAIVCDVMMPDRTGLDLHQLLQSRHPDLLSRVVFMSGGTFTPVLSAFLETVPNTCLKKPFPKDELERAIELAAHAR
jgi:signal transduction histidine kinase